MRHTSLRAALAIALLTALPGVLAADTHIEARVSVDAKLGDALGPGSLPAQPPALGEGAPDVTGVQDRALQLTNVQTDAAGSAGGVDVTASADAKASAQAETTDEPISATILPAVEKAAPPAVATVGVVAILQALGVWRFLGVGAFGLYSRLTKSDLLDNEHRDGVYKLIQERPGLGVSEIAQATGLGWGTTVYHLDRLERVGFVASERGGLHKCYFPVGTVAREARKGMGALKSDATRSIALFLVARPGATQTELCSALGLSASAASKQVSKLEGAGLVRRERDWKTVHLYPQDVLPALLAGQADARAAPLSTPLPV